MRNFIRQKKKYLSLLLLPALAMGTLMPPQIAHAETTSTTPAARISFTFDDGHASTATQAAPILAKYGMKGTVYIATSCIGSSGTCRADTDAAYMNWDQVVSLKDTYGWNIGAHTVNHYCLASNTQPDCQTNVLTAQQVDAELSQSKAALASHGINAVDFAPPYGDYNNRVMAQAAKYYESLRNFRNDANEPNAWPYSDYYLQDYAVKETTTPVNTVKAQIDKAIANKQWLVLVFHDLLPNPNPDPEQYQYGISEFEQIAAYASSKQTAGLIQETTVNKGLVTSDVNLLTNGSFDNGIADGWTTDTPTAFTKDTASNGSFPSATNSIKFTSSTNNAHLFSPKISVDPNSTYILKSFLNVQAITSGEVGYYIDEYDASGNWVSGQYKTAERSAFVESINFSYKPTAPNVSKASLQIIVTGSGIRGYVDNVQWFPVSAAPPRVNQVPNGTFDHGIADGWSTNAVATIVADGSNHGSPNNPVNSVAVTATDTNTHLFSPKVTVDPTKSYSLLAYANITALTGGEIGYYIDEYDASGNWVSGQYKTGVRNITAGDTGMQYAPSSGSVAKASLQVIVTGNSGIKGYVDDVRWYIN